MKQQQPQQPTPDQQKQVKRAKATLWLSIFLIAAVVVGVVFYMYMYREGLIPSAYQDPLYCEQNSDCVIEPECCPSGKSINIYNYEEKDIYPCPDIACSYINLGVECVENTCHAIIKPAQCRQWEPGLCEAVISPGYYYNSESERCNYFSGGSGCSSPPFKTLSECELVCEGKVTNANTNSSTIQTCNDITAEAACNARSDCLSIDFCGCDTRASWHSKCNVEQTEFCNCDMAGFIMCDDLYCSNQNLPVQNRFCKWRPTIDYGTCEKVIGAYYNGSTCVAISGCPGYESMLIPFKSLDDCSNACDSENVDLFNGPVSRSCTEDSDCLFVDKIKDYGECCGPPTCNDYNESKWVTVNKIAFREFESQLIKENQCDAARCPQVMPPQCPIVKPIPVRSKCIDGLCTKEFVSAVLSE